MMNITVKMMMATSRIAAARIRPIFCPKACEAGLRRRTAARSRDSRCTGLTHGSGDDRLGGKCGRGKLGGDAAVAQHEHAVAQVRKLFGIGRIEQDRPSLPCKPHDEIVDLVAGGYIDAAC